MKYAIFDLDGTLVDSMSYWRDYQYAYLRAKNIEIKERIQRLDGETWRQTICDYVRRTYNIVVDPKELIKFGNEYVMQAYATDIDFKPGAQWLLQTLKDNGVKMCICSSTEREIMQPILDRLDIRKYFEFTQHCSEFGSEKSKPGIFLDCIKRLGATEPDEVMVFEDALYSIKTAKALGCYVVGMHDDAEVEGEEVKQTVDQYVFDFTQLDMTKILG